MIRRIVLTSALALTSTLAIAQGSGKSSFQTGKPDANKMNNGGHMNGPTNRGSNARRDGANSGTTGMSPNRGSSEDASPSGAASDAGVNKKSDLTNPRGGDGSDGR